MDVFQSGFYRHGDTKSMLSLVLFGTLLCLIAAMSGHMQKAYLQSESMVSQNSIWPYFSSIQLLPREFDLKESAYDHVWPDLEFNWRVVVGTIIAFVGGSLGCVGGVGGGGIFVPMLTLVMGFDQKSSTALSKCMIMGSAAASVLYNFGLSSPIIDYDLALIFQPALMLGISIGVVFNVIFPNWIVTILLLVLFTGTSLKTFFNGISLWKKETLEKRVVKEAKTLCAPCEAGLENGDYEALPADFTGFEHSSPKVKWTSIAALFYVWISFLVLQVLKNYTKTCSKYYWLYNLLQVPVAASVFFSKAIILYLRKRTTTKEEVYSNSLVKIQWSFPTLFLCAFSGLLAGMVGGLLGLGGGFILGPLFLELGVPPQVASATAIFVMLFSSSMSVIEYYLLHRFPVPFALYLVAVNAAAGFWAQYVLQRVLAFFGRASVIVFILALIIFISAVCLGGYGIRDGIIKLNNHEYMGFLNLCTA